MALVVKVKGALEVLRLGFIRQVYHVVSSTRQVLPRVLQYPPLLLLHLVVQAYDKGL